MSYVYRYLYWVPGPFVPITNIGKLSISGTDIPADLIIGTPLVLNWLLLEQVFRGVYIMLYLEPTSKDHDALYS